MASYHDMQLERNAGGTTGVKLCNPTAKTSQDSYLVSIQKQPYRTGQEAMSALESG